MTHTTLRSGMSLGSTLLLAACSWQPPTQDLINPYLHQGDVAAPSGPSVLTSSGFCLEPQPLGGVVTRPCRDQQGEQLVWWQGRLRSGGYCLGQGGGGLQLAGCDEALRWVWRLGSLQDSDSKLCLDVAGNRHRAGTPLRLADCYGGANQSFSLGEAG
ncbi:ricin-type beta-trefoil lectin domain protein [Aeromonas schubertii]|uniref:Ricin-type beta-trefoil lectin domain protein n=1 Tax=Aeromonas schubertii TaxID=652 RepID=A0ABS7V935_9GAMM|nr:ricin-type beta-trefoil lectin domain protein [Aeromonas schubertii]KUE78513.1 hypothetical protein ATO46_09110 [Aeromonas schubertii]MBZ6065922.1 ricin-type beta-trefoil lectin domain protein [Aeromonas schubertii]MBZ6072682.1 ricin-type beta-trefoil lectin domain protein [Aeromonas schubertii]QCG49749.1 lectin [Aeromonas schubertii]